MSSNGRIRKSFGTKLPSTSPGLELELNTEVFKVRSKMSGLALLRVIKGMDGDDEGAAAEVMFEFLEKTFLKEDRERGMDYLENSDPPIDIAELQKIIQWLIGEYTGNPTGPSSSSTDGSVTTGSTSTDEPSATASISEISTPTTSPQLQPVSSQSLS